MLKKVYIYRTRRSDHGTEGYLSTYNFSCFTLELPYKDNLPNISCIEMGTYQVVTRTSLKFGQVYHIAEVPDRSNILIHSGNFAGDAAKGLKTHVQGCILLGKYRGILEKQRAVLCSRPTVRAFMNALEMAPFELVIQDEL